MSPIALAKDRVTSWLIVGMTSWWLAFPLALSAGLAIFSESHVDAFLGWVGRALLWTGLGGAVIAPIGGLVVAMIGRRRRACVYFAGMAALSLLGFLLILHALDQA